MTTQFFPLNHTIVNSSFLDQSADVCLSPLRYLTNLLPIDLPKIREFEIDPITKSCRDVSSIDENPLIIKICKFVFALLLVIPASIIGVVLKEIAQQDPDVLAKQKILINSGLIHDQSIVKELKARWGIKPLKEKQIIKFDDWENQHQSAITDVFYKAIFFVGIKDIFSLNQVCKSIWFGLHSNLYTPNCQEYQQQLNGLKKIEGIKTFNQLAYKASEYYETYYHYDKWLLGIFGDIKNILKLPIKGIKAANNEAFSATIQRFSTTETYKQCPSIFRLKVIETSHVDRETIVIKYSSFQPKEDLKINEDKVFHGYLYLACVERNAPLFLGNSSLFKQFDLKGETARFTKFIQGQPIGIYENKIIKPTFIANSYLDTPYVGTRLFNDTPAMLGHLNISDFTSILKSEYLPDMIPDANGNLVIQKKRPGNYAFITF